MTTSAKKILIFGNSGSGKSTLAKRLSHEHQLAHLDLDTLAWQPCMPPARKPLAESAKAIEAFTSQHKQWVIEGCYSDLLRLVIAEATEIYFMDLPIAHCQANARNRPWEPHKYPSKQAQDDNLTMLLTWIADYEQRQDDFSRAAHQALYQHFTGKKKLLDRNP